MLEKNWCNVSICRIKHNKTVIPQIVEQSRNENDILFSNIDELREYIINHNLNIILPAEYKFIIIQTTNNIKEQNFLNKIINYYIKKYKLNDVPILYILQNISENFIKSVINILKPICILVTDSVLIQYLLNNNHYRQRGEILEYNNNTRIIYTLSLNIVMKNTTYIQIFSKDINTYIQYINNYNKNVLCIQL